MAVDDSSRLGHMPASAASRVSADKRSELSDIPRPDIVSMRNRLIHGYFDIDLDRVWDTVVDDPPPLIASLQKVLEA